LRRTLRGVNAGLSLTPALVPREAAKRDADDFACGVDAEKQARRVAAREDKFQDREGLIALLCRLHDFGAQRGRSVPVEVMRYSRHRLVGHLGSESLGILRAIGPAGLISVIQCNAQVVRSARVYAATGGTDVGVILTLLGNPARDVKRT
jgi:hypothetical protein